MNNKISIEINCSAKKVFAFTTNADNSHLWIPGILGEVSTDLFPIESSRYERLLDIESVSYETYIVVDILDNSYIKMMSLHEECQFSYIYEELGENRTKFSILEEGDNKRETFNMRALEILKELVENS